MQARCRRVTYLDGTEEPPDRSKSPGFCPLCQGPLVTKWSAVVQHRARRGYFAIAVPAHTCEECRITVRVNRLPRRSLYATRKAARASMAKDLAVRNEKRDNPRGLP
jgi:transposase